MTFSSELSLLSSKDPPKQAKESSVMLREVLSADLPSGKKKEPPQAITDSSKPSHVPGEFPTPSPMANEQGRLTSTVVNKRDEPKTEDNLVMGILRAQSELKSEFPILPPGSAPLVITLAKGQVSESSSVASIVSDVVPNLTGRLKEEQNEASEDRVKEMEEGPPARVRETSPEKLRGARKRKRRMFGVGNVEAVVEKGDREDKEGSVEREGGGSMVKKRPRISDSSPEVARGGCTKWGYSMCTASGSAVVGVAVCNFEHLYMYMYRTASLLHPPPLFATYMCVLPGKKEWGGGGGGGGHKSEDLC